MCACEKSHGGISGFVAESKSSHRLLPTVDGLNLEHLGYLGLNDCLKVYISV